MVVKLMHCILNSLIGVQYLRKLVKQFEAQMTIMRFWETEAKVHVCKKYIKVQGQYKG